MGRYTLKSSKTKLVLSLDPSGNFINGYGKTGYVLSRTSDTGYAVLDKGTIDAKDYDSALEFWSAHLDIIQPGLDALVVEDYLLYPSVNQSFSYMETPRLIGIIQMHAHILDIPTIMQRATETSFLKESFLVEKGILEKETCDLGYDNYRCDEIKDGTVIIKHSTDGTEEDTGQNDDLDDAEEL